MNYVLLAVSLIEAICLYGLLKKNARLERELETECSAELAELYEENAQLRAELRDASMLNATQYFDGWTAPTTEGVSCPHGEACSKAFRLTPPG